MSLIETKQFYNFIIYDSDTLKPIYTRYNFNFDLYKADFGLDPELPQYDTFTDFFNRVGFDWGKPYYLPPEYVKYFTPITDLMIAYTEYYGFSFHYGYLAVIVPDTFVYYGVLRRAQCDLVYYNDLQVRRLQDYYFDDGERLYTKYNFDFYNYAMDFNLHGNKLLIFTDFTIRCVNLSGVVNTSASYGLPEQFKKYFYIIPNDALKKYITYYGVNSVLTNDYRNYYNIDFSRFVDVNPSLKPYLDPIYAKEFYIRTGQFDFYNIPFYYKPNNKYDTLKSSCCVVTTTDGNTTSGFLCKTSDFEENRYLVTCYHVISSNDLYVYGDFQLKQVDTYTSTTTRAQFKIIGYDIIGDVLLALFDPTLSYNVVNGITNLDDYPSIPIDFNTNITNGTSIFTLSDIENQNFISLNFGSIVDKDYTGLIDETNRPPSYLINTTLPMGSSGSPLFYEKDDGSMMVIGMINSCMPNDKQYGVSIKAYFLYNIVEALVANYYYYSALYANNIVRYNNSIKYGYITSWLGVDSEYWSPISKMQYKQLANLNYTGGLLIKNFILGFDTSTNQRIYNAEDLNKKEIFVLNGPLLNSNMYKRFLSSGNVPIVLVSASYFDSLYSNYILREFGKFSNQVAFSYFLYGCQSIGTYALDDPLFTNSFKNLFPDVTFTYYYYNGSNWVLETETIGGNDESWYVIYTDNYGNRFYQHKFEFPFILLDYVKYFMPHIGSSGNLYYTDGTNKYSDTDSNVRRSATSLTGYKHSITGRNLTYQAG